MLAIRQQIQKIAQYDIPILIWVRAAAQRGSRAIPTLPFRQARRLFLKVKLRRASGSFVGK